MKKQYILPQCTIIQITSTDLICTSGDDDNSRDYSPVGGGLADEFA